MAEFKPTTIGIKEAISDVVDNNIFSVSKVNRVLLEHLKTTTGNKVDIVDPTNPLVFLLEASIVTASSALKETILNTRRIYPSLIRNQEDQYRHMTDLDYVGLFSYPSKASFHFLVAYNEFKDKAVYVPSNKYKKLVIPRNTIIEVNNLFFTLLYPIEIIEYDNGVLVVQHDTSITNDLQPVVGNALQYTIRNDISNVPWIHFQVDLLQLYVDSAEYSITAGSTTKETFVFKDKYHHADIYYRDSAGKWVKMHTTHNDIVYDPSKPTALLKVVGDNLHITVPSVYNINGTIGSLLRAVVYTTKGYIDVNLNDYKLSDFKISRKIIDKDQDSNQFTAIAPNVTTAVFSGDRITGGKDGLSYQQLRDNIIDHTLGPINTPITDTMLSVKHQYNDYTIMKSLDIPCSRSYVAIKDRLLVDPNSSIEIDATMATVTIKDTDISDKIHYHDKRVIIQSGNIFVDNNEIITPLSKTAYDSLMGMSVTGKSDYVINNQIYYNPFYYILDRNGKHLQVNVYDMDSPELSILLNSDINSKLNVQVSTGAIAVSKKDNKYIIDVTTKSNNVYRQLPDMDKQAQLSIPIQGLRRGYINATQVDKTADGEMVYRFVIETNFDITPEHKIEITNLTTIYLEETQYVPIELDIDIIYTTTSNVVNHDYSKLDLLINKNILPDNVIAISRETMKLIMGRHLANIWARGTEGYITPVYETYTEDVPAYYKKDVYAINPDTGTIFTIDPNTCDMTYNIIHHKGDPVLRPDGSPVLEHKKGDPVLDSSGQPVVTNTNEFKIYLDMLLLDGAYLLANEDSYVKYREDVKNLIRDRIVKEVPVMEQSMIEHTNLYYSSKKTNGNIEVLLADNTSASIPARNTINITAYIEQSVLNNKEVIDKVKKAIVQLVSVKLKDTNISFNNFKQEINDELGDIVKGINIVGLPSVNTGGILQVKNNQERLATKKKLTVISDNKTIVEPYINIDIVKVQ